MVHGVEHAGDGASQGVIHGFNAHSALAKDGVSIMDHCELHGRRLAQKPDPA
jgi:hypothetical protein